VCLEVPVTVNGVRAAAGSDKREPFSENTRTVIVFANGGVLRLSAALAPGQLIFLVNERTKKEIVCQVVKSKNYRNVSGYVEVEFTEPSLGFWGMRFPGDKIVQAARAAQEENPSANNRSVSEPELTRDIAPAAPLVDRPQVAASLLTTEQPAAELLRPLELSSGLTSAEDSLPSALPPKDELPSAAPAAMAPAPSGSSPESVALSASSKTKSPSAEETETEGLPEWLTPRAYSGLAAPVRPVPADSLSKSIAELAATIEANTPQKHVEAPIHEEALPVAMPHPGAIELAAELPPIETSALLGERTFAHAGKTRGRSFLYGAVAAVVLAGLGGGWWYFQNTQKPANQTAAVIPAVVPPAPSPASAAANFVPAGSGAGAAGATSQPTPVPAAPAPAETTKPAPISTAAFVQPPAEKGERTVSSAKKESGKESNREMSAGAKTAANPKAAAAEPAKKSVMPKMQLAAPIVVRNSRPQGGASPELNLGNMPGVPLGTDAAGMLAATESQPAAPKPENAVGGDVRPAKMTFSVRPAYPFLAQKQHVGGSVVLNAEILANGSVGQVKVISGPILLQQAAIDAVKQWKYQPAMLDGKATASQVTVTLQFHTQ
jgi:protein TonB